MNEGLEQLKTKAVVKTGKKNKIAWAIIEEHYFTKNIELARTFTKPGDPLSFDLSRLIREGYTLEKVAKDFGIHEGTVRNKAAHYKWKVRLRNKIAEVNEKSSDQAVEELELDIKKLRQRHATIARLAVSKAVIQLKALDPQTLSPSDLIKFIEVGQKEERKALGIPDKLEIEHKPFAGDSNFHTVSDHIKSHAEKLQMLSVIANLMKENKMLKEKDVVDV